MTLQMGQHLNLSCLYNNNNKKDEPPYHRVEIEGKFVLIITASPWAGELTFWCLSC